MAGLNTTATYTTPFSQPNTLLFLDGPLLALFGGVDNDVIAPSAPTAPRGLDRSSCGLLPMNGSVGAPLIADVVF